MKLFTVFASRFYQELLRSNDLADFDSVWNLKTPWFEEPNVRRGGWSGVVRYMLQSSEEPVEVFIKRQEGHISRTFFHPVKGVLTLKKEYNSIKRLQRYGVPTLNPVYFACKDDKAVLITLGLSDHVSLDKIDPSSLSVSDKRTLIAVLATVLRTLHKHHLQHNCLYPKHIFVKKTDGAWEVRIIDLEKMKRTLLQRSAMCRDLSTLIRHADPAWGPRDLVLFLRYYFNESTLSPNSRKKFHQVAADVKRKTKSM